MSLRSLPKINAKAPTGVQWDTRSDVLSKWDNSLVSAESKDATITMYDNIGSDGWSEGVTAKRISAALRSIGDRDVKVVINSPGGDFFEGIAIYNILREHPHKVTVQVVGLAASAAAIVAMAGDEVQIAKTAYLMIHNAWVFAIGNRHDLREAASVLDIFDNTMAGLYSDVSGMSKKEVITLLDNETFMTGEEAIEMGFATSLLDSDKIAVDKTDDTNATVRKVDTLLAKQGIPRSERRELLKELKGTQNAALVTPSADLLLQAQLFTQTLRGNKS